MGILESSDTASASDLYKEAIELYDSTLDKDLPGDELGRLEARDEYIDFASTLLKSASLADRSGEWRVALTLYRQSLHIFKAVLGGDDLQVAQVLNSIANLLGRQFMYDKAMVLLEESLRIRLLHLGPDHPEVAAVLIAIGVAFDKRTEYTSAMMAYTDALRIRKLAFGEKSVEVAEIMANIGIVKGNKADLEGAMAIWDEALEMLIDLGCDSTHPLVESICSHREVAKDMIT